MWLSVQNGCSVLMVAVASVIFCRMMLLMSSVVVKVAPKYLIVRV